MQNHTVRRFASGLVILGAFALSCASPEGDPNPTGSGGTGGSGTGSAGSGGTSGGGTTGIGGSPSGGTGGGAAGTGMAGSGAAGSGAAGTGMAGSGAAGSGTGGSGRGGASAGSAGNGTAGSGMAGGGGAGTGGRGGRGGAAGGVAGTGGGMAGRGGSTGTGGATGTAGTTGTGGEAAKTAGCGSTTAPANGTYTISVNGTSRTYILKRPDNYDPSHAHRLMLAFHWLNGTAQNVASGNYYGLWSLSQGSTIFVAPQGIGNAWRDSGRTNTMGGEDINFTKALVTDLSNKLCIDKSRIFAEGFSMGGSMSYAVACAMGDVVRAVVAHSGGPMSGCVQHNKPVAYFMTHGTQDSVCTYPQYGVPQVNDFGMVNGCGTQTMPMPSGSEHLCVDYPNCMPAYPTRACIFVGDHTASPPGNWVPMESWKFISQF